MALPPIHLIVKNLHKCLSGAVFLLAISVFFFYSLEEIPCPSGAIVLNSDGIDWGFGLRNYSIIASTEQTIVVDYKDYELADVDDFTYGEFDI